MPWPIRASTSSAAKQPEVVAPAPPPRPSAKAGVRDRGADNSNFNTAMMYTGFGERSRPVGDINGDGKPDFMIGYQNGFAGVLFAWLVYGR